MDQQGIYCGYYYSSSIDFILLSTGIRTAPRCSHHCNCPLTYGFHSSSDRTRPRIQRSTYALVGIVGLIHSIKLPWREDMQVVRYANNIHQILHLIFATYSNCFCDYSGFLVAACARRGVWSVFKRPGSLYSLALYTVKKVLA